MTTSTAQICQNVFLEADGFCTRCGCFHFTNYFGKRKDHSDAPIPNVDSGYSSPFDGSPTFGKPGMSDDQFLDPDFDGVRDDVPFGAPSWKPTPKRRGRRRTTTTVKVIPTVKAVQLDGTFKTYDMPRWMKTRQTKVQTYLKGTPGTVTLLKKARKVFDQICLDFSIHPILSEFVARRSEVQYLYKVEDATSTGWLGNPCWFKLSVKNITIFAKKGYNEYKMVQPTLTREVPHWRELKGYKAVTLMVLHEMAHVLHYYRSSSNLKDTKPHGSEFLACYVEILRYAVDNNLV